MATISLDFLSGKTQDHLQTHPRIGHPLHHQVIRPFLGLQREALKQGFDLTITSSFRPYDRQLLIWNEKVLGKRPVMDHEGKHPLDISILSPRELVFSILRWSALPGTSRHHWGTDMDVFDKKALPPGYRVQLLPEEVDPGGMFGPFHLWLDEKIGRKGSFWGFYRPYDKDRGGVSPEKWHLSYAPLAQTFSKAFRLDLFRQLLRESDQLALKDVLWENHEEIYHRFVITQ